MEVVLAGLFTPVLVIFVSLMVAALVAWLFGLIIDAIRGWL